MTILRWPGLSLILLLFFAQPAGALGEYHYYFFKKPVPLDLRSGIFAIYAERENDQDSINERFSSAGIPAFQIADMPVRGWSLWQLSGAALADPELTIAAFQAVESSRRHFISPVFEARQTQPIFPTLTILLRLRKGVDVAFITELLAETIRSEFTVDPFGGMSRAYKVSTGLTSGLEVLSLANLLAQHPDVRFSEPNMVLGGVDHIIPNDPDFSKSWGLHNTGQEGGPLDLDIDAPEAWDITTGDPSIITVVIDTGVEQDHPDLNQIPGKDFTDDSSTDGGPVNRCDNHGTPVAGIISEVFNNSLGTSGAAPHTVIASARTYKSSVPFNQDDPCPGTWFTSTQWTVDALAWAESIGARVTNNSNSFNSDHSSIADKYAETRAAGLLHFASAGNDFGNPVAFPAKLPSVNAISALSPNGNLAEFSNFGPEIIYTGPGVNMWSTDRTGADGESTTDYTWFGGTSAASPGVAGVAALILSWATNLDVDETAGILAASAMDLGPAGWDEKFGAGLPNARNALDIIAIFDDDFETVDLSQWTNSVEN